jgi:protein TonB
MRRAVFFAAASIPAQRQFVAPWQKPILLLFQLAGPHRSRQARRSSVRNESQHQSNHPGLSISPCNGVLGWFELSEKGKKARAWVLAATLAALAHAGAWYGLSSLRDDSMPPPRLTVIEAALLAPPPAPETAPKPPEPLKPSPKPKAKPRANPEPRPLLQAQAVLAQVAEKATEPAPVMIVAAPPAPAPEAPPVAVPEPIVEAPRFNAAYLNNPPPAYPLAARRRGMEGRVMVRAEVQQDGRCAQVELKQGSGHELLDRAALEAVGKWRFVPARQGGQAVTAWVEVPITFKLNN